MYPLAFEQVLASHGIPLPKTSIDAGHFTRWGENSRYFARAVEDGYIYGDWSQSISDVWFPNASAPPSNERAKARKAAQTEARTVLKQEQIQAASEAMTLWERCTPADGNHPYLMDKQISAYDIRKYEGALVVPLYDTDGKLWSLQFIQAGGKKYFLTHGRVHGCFHTIGKVKSHSPIIYIAEGYATAVSIHLAVNHLCIIAFNAGNLEPVTAALRQKYPECRIIIAADNDQWKERNTGKEKAEAAAAKHGCTVILPEFSDTVKKEHKPTDFNDLYCLEGLKAVKRQLAQAAPSTQKPIIVIQGGGLSDEATEGEKALIAAAVQIYQRGANLVRPITH